MSDKTTILIKTDKKVKAAAQKSAKQIGIPLSTLMGMYLRKFAHDQRFDFEVPLVPTPYLRKILKENESDFKAGKYKGPFKNLDELFEALTK